MYKKRAPVVCWVIFPGWAAGDNAHGHCCLCAQHSRHHTNGQFPSTSTWADLISGTEMQFWAPSLRLNMGPLGSSPSSSSASSSSRGTAGLWRRWPGKHWGLHTNGEAGVLCCTWGESGEGPRYLADIHLCTWGDKWKNVTQSVQHQSRGREEQWGTGRVLPYHY